MPEKNKELSISDLEHILDFTQTKTSRHLIYLKNAGLVGSRRVDQWTFYYILENKKIKKQKSFPILKYYT